MIRSAGLRAWQAVRLISSAPHEAWTRIAVKAEVWLDRMVAKRTAYARVDWRQATGALQDVLGGSIDSVLGEAELAELASRLELREPSHASGIPAHHDGDPYLARLCYLLTRLLRPDTVVETGTARGVTTAHILAALEKNGNGRLHSVDLPPLRPGAADEVGMFVPQNLRGRWSLHRGSSRKVLPGLLAGLGPVGLFVHDSLHTYRHMRWEFGQVGPRLAPRAAVVADDILANAAFGEWTRRTDLTTSFVIGQAGKDSAIGVGLRLPP